MIVTDIADMDKKRKKVYIEGEYAFALYNQEIYRYNIEVGTELDDRVYQELDGEVIPKRVKARTLYILKSSQKTEKQLYDKLTEGGYSHRYANIGVEYAKKFGYVDDLRYAEYFVENSCRGRSRRDIEKSFALTGMRTWKRCGLHCERSRLRLRISAGSIMRRRESCLLI